ncbi:uncharacterized protein B0T23DRAFT_394400 [Neurospora hispaniola]|uniref:Uncharacterized protein n=1 Tax=Neurospora hispaniola TaxID=588809 RepID=A0AAJ0I9M1_9PEZI|nr:hypothetical protein B0T23DRAFT_394400 [Neurospora hispaniola]
MSLRRLLRKLFIYMYWSSVSCSNQQQTTNERTKGKEWCNKKKKKKCIYIQLSTPTSNSNFSGLKAQSTPSNSLGSYPIKFTNSTVQAHDYQFVGNLPITYNVEYLYSTLDLITTFFVTCTYQHKHVFVQPRHLARYLDYLARNILRSPTPTLRPLYSSQLGYFHRFLRGKMESTNPSLVLHPTKREMNNARTHARTYVEQPNQQAGPDACACAKFHTCLIVHASHRYTHAIASCVCVLEGASWRMDLGCSIQVISDHGEKPLDSRNNQPTNSFASTDEICAAIQIGLQCLDEVAMQIHRLGLYERQRT